METETAEKIGQVLTAKSQKSAQPSTCKCGAVIEPVSTEQFTLTPGECRDCEDTRKHKEAVSEADQATKRFESVIPKLYHAAKMQHLTPALQEQLQGLGDSRGLYLWGPVGSGKSYALSALARHYIEARHQVRRVVWGRVLYDIRRTYRKQGSDESTILGPLLTASRLIVEDVGAAASLDKQESDFSNRVLLMILDTRIEDCLPVYITSNLSIESLGNVFDERIASRVRGCCSVIQLKGKDRRAGA